MEDLKNAKARLVQAQRDFDDALNQIAAKRFQQRVISMLPKSIYSFSSTGDGLCQAKFRNGSACSNAVNYDLAGPNVSFYFYPSRSRKILYVDHTNKIIGACTKLDSEELEEVLKDWTTVRTNMLDVYPTLTEIKEEIKRELN